VASRYNEWKLLDLLVKARFMDETTQNNSTLILQTLCAANQPLSRLEIARAIEPTVIPDLRGLLEDMLKSGTLTSTMSATENETAVVRYMVGKDVDCSSL
jgi:hypothetical protein